MSPGRKFANAAEVTITMTAGRKDDAGKLPLSVLPWDALREVVKVMVFGAKKYGWGNWRSVVNGEQRYVDAALRHLTEHVEGKLSDHESSLPTLAHAATSALFALAIHVTKKVTP